MLPRYINWITNFRGLRFNEEMPLLWLKYTILFYLGYHRDQFPFLSVPDYTAEILLHFGRIVLFHQIPEAFDNPWSVDIPLKPSSLKLNYCCFILLIVWILGDKLIAQLLKPSVSQRWQEDIEYFSQFVTCVSLNESNKIRYLCDKFLGILM